LKTFSNLSSAVKNVAKKIILFFVLCFFVQNVWGQAPTIASFAPLTGYSGTIITIKGQYFTGATSVSFGGTNAFSFTVDADTSITAVVGNGASGNVAVTTPSGTITLAGFTFASGAPIPAIISFSPAYGPVGTAVTITGNNFNTNAISDIVNFGGTRATVISASSSSIIAIVPIGATYQPITVTTNGLTATASKAFDVTFAARDTVFSATSFAPKTTFVFGGQPDGYPDIADYNIDGKNDILMGGHFAAIGYYQNTSADNSISIATKKPYGSFNQPIVFADINGDGKRDMLSEGGGNAVQIYLNKSANGTVILDSTGSSFVAASGYPSFVNVECMGDLDGDGRPDLISATSSFGVPNKIFINKNTSSVASLSFATAQSFSTVGGQPTSLKLYDLNGDGKPDIIATTASGLSFYKNTSSPGTISFAAGTTLSMTDTPQFPAFADLDGDGEPEIITADYTTATVSVLKNTSSGGAISFAAEQTFATGVGPYSVSIDDLDGDGKLDIAVANYTSATVSVLRNNSTGSTISFQTKVDYTVAGNPNFISIGDLDGDSKPDIVVSSTGTNSFYILHNLGSLSSDLCIPAGSAALVSSLSGTAYQWQVDSAGSYININNDANYSGTGTGTLQLSNIPSSWSGYKYRCVVDGNNSAIFTLKFNDTWTGAVDSDWSNPSNWSCGAVPDVNTDVIINSGTIILNTNATVKSLTLNPGVIFTVSSGYNLTITH
jgi:hypothetical protein